MITKNSAKINDTPEIYPYDLQYAYDNDELGKLLFRVDCRKIYAGSLQI